MYVQPPEYFFLTVPNNEGSATKYFEVPNNALPATILVPNNATLIITIIIIIIIITITIITIIIIIMLGSLSV